MEAHGDLTKNETVVSLTTTSSNLKHHFTSNLTIFSSIFVLPLFIFGEGEGKPEEDEDMPLKHILKSIPVCPCNKEKRKTSEYEYV